MKLTPSQQSIYKKFLEVSDSPKISISMQTGSGKTYMMYNTIKHYQTTLKNPLFIVVAPSTGSLPQQITESFKFYDQDLKVRHANTHITKITEDVLVFGLASFGKGRIFTKKRYLQNIFYENAHRDIVLIKDEAHYADLLLSSGSNNSFNSTIATLLPTVKHILLFSATHKGYHTDTKVVLQTQEDLDLDIAAGISLIKPEKYLQKNALK